MRRLAALAALWSVFAGAPAAFGRESPAPRNIPSSEPARASLDDLRPKDEVVFEARIRDLRFLSASLFLNERRFEAEWALTYVHQGEPPVPMTFNFAASWYRWDALPLPRTHHDLRVGALVLVRMPPGADRLDDHHIIKVLQPGQGERPFSAWRVLEIWVTLLVVLVVFGFWKTFSGKRFRSLVRLFVTARPYYGMVALVFVFMIVSTAAQYVPALVLEPLIDRILPPPHDLSLLQSLIVFMIIVAVVQAVTDYYAELLYRTVMWRVTVDLRCQLGTRLLQQSLRFFTTSRIGDLISRLINDVIVNQTALRFLFGDFIRQLLLVIIGVAISVLLSWQLALVTFVGLPLLLVPLGRFARRINRESMRGLESLSNVLDVLQQQLSGIRSIKAFRIEEHEKARFRVANMEFFKRVMRVGRDKAKSRATIMFVTGAASAAIIGLGIFLVREGYFGLTSGRLVAFLAATGIIYKPARAIIKEFNELSEALAATDRIFHLLDVPFTDHDRQGAVEAPVFARAITFENVSFSYDGKVTVLHDVSFRAPKGTMTAFVGRAGAGKSTILDLIARFYFPDAGVIRLDGVDTASATLESVLRQIAVVTQDPFLFNTSVRENIRLGKLDATQEEIEAAARIAHIHDEIAAKTDGYDTIVGERGMNLSGGQRQRVTIARAVLKNAPILLLDEATSSLDSEGERAIQMALEDVRKGRTTFAIAHRLSTILHADQIIVIDEGRMVATGTHAELLDSCALYRQVYELQFGRQAAPDRPSP